MCIGLTRGLTLPISTVSYSSSGLAPFCLPPPLYQVLALQAGARLEDALNMNAYRRPIFNL